LSAYKDIKWVDSHAELFSSDRDITIFDQPDDFELPMFISMDQPKHHAQRKVVSPVVAPRNLAVLEDTIRQRVCTILDSLPVGETFNWVDRVSIDLTTQMLATLLDFPFEDREKLTYWSDVAGGGRLSGVVDSANHRRKVLMECLAYFQDLWQQRADMVPNNDLISMLVHGEATRNMPPLEYLGNLVLLIVGGNDTTRNSITGGVLALNQFPEQYEKLLTDPSVIPNMVAEIIRWQTPLPHMRRTALEDVEINEQQIHKGDKVIMWYISGNRDETQFKDANKLIIDRKNARSHVSFGFGIHRCMGNRLAEMQLRVLWEEILPRFKVEVVGAPVRVRSNLIRGYSELPVRIKPY
jgi:cytochrome P450